MDTIEQFIQEEQAFPQRSAWPHFIGDGQEAAESCPKPSEQHDALQARLDTSSIENPRITRRWYQYRSSETASARSDSLQSGRLPINGRLTGSTIRPNLHRTSRQIRLDFPGQASVAVGQQTT
jgi:hypothetical protein